jgi:hypothetical protein
MLGKTITRLSVSLAVMFVINGCANNPEIRSEEKLKSDEVESYVDGKVEEFNRVWSERDPAITFLERDDDVFVEKIYDLPKKLKDKKIIGLYIKNGSTLKDMVGLLYPYKTNIMFSDKEIAELPISLKRYSGTLGELFEMIEGLHNLSFEYIGHNTVKITDKTTYMASFPQVEQVLDSVSENLESLGAEEIKTNVLAGSVVYQATTREQKDIIAFVDRFYENYAGVKLQVTVFNVSLQETLSDGFDWSSLDVVMGHVEAAYAGGTIRQLLAALDGQNQQNGGGVNGGLNGGGVNGGVNGGNNQNNQNNQNNGDTPNFGYGSRYAGSSIDDIRSFGWLNDERFELGAFNKNLSMSVALDWMNQYGNTEARQSAFIETMTGKETVISSQRRVPVIADESTTLVGNLSPVATQNTSTDEEEIGVKVTFTPFYDSSSQEMIIDLEVNLKNLVGNRTLTSATGQKFDRPEIQEENFPTMIRMKVGETKLLGGIVFDTVITDRNDVNILDMDEDFIRKNMSKSAMFIMVRPSVHLFTQPGGSL